MFAEADEFDGCAVWEGCFEFGGGLWFDRFEGFFWFRFTGGEGYCSWCDYGGEEEDCKNSDKSWSCIEFFAGGHDGFYSVFDIFDRAGNGKGGNGHCGFVFCDEGVDDGGGIVFGGGGKFGNGGFVAGLFAFCADESVCEPYEGVEPKDGLGDNLEEVYEGVESFYVGEFMSQDGTPAGGRGGFGEVCGQVD